MMEYKHCSKPHIPRSIGFQPSEEFDKFFPLDDTPVKPPSADAYRKEQNTTVRSLMAL